MNLFFIAIILTALSGVPGLFLSARTVKGQVISLVLTFAGSFLGVAAAAGSFFTGAETVELAPLGLWTGGLTLRLDSLAAIFLVSIFLIPALGALHGLGYWRQTDHPQNGRKLRFFYGWVTAGMALVVAAKGVFLFFVAWEIMALSAFFLVSTEDEKKDTREAGWIYFVATHVSTLLLFAFFSLWSRVSGSWELNPLQTVAPGDANLLFLLALVAFGIKAGLFPFHVWLPSAHANAPTHVSALLSGVLLKVGVYGLMRVCWLLPHPPLWWGDLVLGLGIVSTVLGVVFAIGQHDLKRLLAYHSVENIGIIFLGLGLGILGRSYGRPEWVLWGMAGALLHVWNHGLFKAMLFLSAGSILRALHTRNLEEMGGLAKRMPKTALAFLVGAAAICGLPPLNGFISELFIFLGLFKTFLFTGGVKNGLLLLAAPALALTGGLALACFTKAYGAVFLGSPRNPTVHQAKESGWPILAPLFLLGLACLAIGLFPALVAPLLESAVHCWNPDSLDAAFTLSQTLPLALFPLLGTFLLILVLGGFWFLSRRGPVAYTTGLTWDCGYVFPGPSMQYSASSYAQMLVHFFKWVLLPEGKDVRLKGPFPEKSSFHTHTPETVLDRILLPLIWAGQWLMGWAKWIQLGYPQAYIFYIAVTLMLLILLG